MDLSIFINMMLSAAWYLIPSLIIISIIKSSWFKGLLGEWQVNLLIKLFLDKNMYHLIKNVTLPTFINNIEQGTTQIDHIIVSQYGIFVVETKNMKGWIFGGENQKQWTQQIYRHKSKFQNRLHQNYKHVKTLESCLFTDNNSGNTPIFSVIIFIGDSTFKSKMPDNVRFARGGIRYIKSKTDIVFNTEETQSIIEQIESGRLEYSFKTNRQHVKHVKEIIQAKTHSKLCSKCGAEMVLRKATKGKHSGNEFWGCSMFPKCRNIIQARRY
ncbi:NERD domain-containing protein [Colwellia sp. 1_MG-2023]|uniref:nuclease-related domain-containing protein n=1 Tax=unclassified Colwellia TaxID=196834 RepID=UPI001C07F30D|nr:MULTISPECIES: NERD domain-containing protein [unclassified Colwellia]MBU2923469.1 NERD domain-containing protein [Colwellia sp. C2M11]MDO6653829.1 NERD domain-containing protein [Colwellia sp. 3_MG-2023]MDO6666659.1 NERD domain-containing protein [Colwellia sp. 2_MG-2023]MDO6691100.1 NERD domain-containing protein [Colwellia sp. 1_MG-2023]